MCGWMLRAGGRGKGKEQYSTARTSEGCYEQVEGKGYSTASTTRGTVLLVLLVLPAKDVTCRGIERARSSTASTSDRSALTRDARCCGFHARGCTSTHTCAHKGNVVFFFHVHTRKRIRTCIGMHT